MTTVSRRPAPAVAIDPLKAWLDTLDSAASNGDEKNEVTFEDIAAEVAAITDKLGLKPLEIENTLKACSLSAMALLAGKRRALLEKMESNAILTNTPTAGIPQTTLSDLAFVEAPPPNYNLTYAKGMECVLAGKLKRNPFNEQNIDTLEGSIDCPVCTEPITSDTEVAMPAMCMHANHSWCMNEQLHTAEKEKKEATCSLCRGNIEAQFDEWCKLHDLGFKRKQINLGPNYTTKAVGDALMEAFKANSEQLTPDEISKLSKIFRGTHAIAFIVQSLRRDEAALMQAIAPKTTGAGTRAGKKPVAFPPSIASRLAGNARTPKSRISPSQALPLPLPSAPASSENAKSADDAMDTTDAVVLPKPRQAKVIPRPPDSDTQMGGTGNDPSRTSKPKRKPDGQTQDAGSSEARDAKKMNRARIQGQSQQDGFSDSEPRKVAKADQDIIDTLKELLQRVHNPDIHENSVTFLKRLNSFAGIIASNEWDNLLAELSQIRDAGQPIPRDVAGIMNEMIALIKLRTKELNVTRETITTGMQSLKEANDKAAQIEKDKDQIQAEQRKSVKTIDRLKKQIEEKEVAITDLNNRVNYCVTKLATFQTNGLALEATHNSTVADQERLHKLVEELRAAVLTEQGTIHTLKQQLQTAVQLVAERDASIVHLNREMERANKMHEDGKNLQQAYNALVETDKKQEEKLQTLQKMLDAATDKGSVTTAEQDLSTARIELAKTKGELLAANRQATTLQTNTNALQEQYDNAAAGLTTAQAKVVDLKKLLNQLCATCNVNETDTTDPDQTKRTTFVVAFIQKLVADKDQFEMEAKQTASELESIRKRVELLQIEEAKLHQIQNSLLVPIPLPNAKWEDYWVAYEQWLERMRTQHVLIGQLQTELLRLQNVANVFDADGRTVTERAVFFREQLNAMTLQYHRAAEQIQKLAGELHAKQQQAVKTAPGPEADPDRHRNSDAIHDFNVWILLYAMWQWADSVTPPNITGEQLASFHEGMAELIDEWRKSKLIRVPDPVMRFAKSVMAHIRDKLEKVERMPYNLMRAYKQGTGKDSEPLKLTARFRGMPFADQLALLPSTTNRALFKYLSSAVNPVRFNIPIFPMNTGGKLDKLPNLVTNLLLPFEEAKRRKETAGVDLVDQIFVVEWIDENQIQYFPSFDRDVLFVHASDTSKAIEHIHSKTTQSSPWSLTVVHMMVQDSTVKRAVAALPSSKLRGYITHMGLPNDIQLAAHTQAIVYVQRLLLARSALRAEAPKSTNPAECLRYAADVLSACAGNEDPASTYPAENMRTSARLTESDIQNLDLLEQ